ncbi:unnamed protein product [Microthlaspi erraticum]|uniref:Uncharacterized protein n=1 Tax=Microthlaspi erraticum TaxID=1685480 RepID=A0A6D2J3M0_9BRAS|nr:unnamed protein product [Microthlaspi erraticum]
MCDIPSPIEWEEAQILDKADESPTLAAPSSPLLDKKRRTENEEARSSLPTPNCCRNRESSAAVAATSDLTALARVSAPDRDPIVVPVRRSRREPTPSQRLLDSAATSHHRRRSAAPDPSHQ